MSEDAPLRIGELSRRAGVSPELLRAWERRYDLLHPARSPGGLRLYSLDDLERVRLMSRHISEGLGAREAAALARRARLSAEPTTPPPGRESTTTPFDPEFARAELARTTEAFDEPGAQTVLDELLAVATLDALLSQVVVPYLHELGERWERGELSVAQEHFASNLLRGRLLGLARGWGSGGGPRALLACPPGERHDLGLIVFGLALRNRGWRIDFLGSDTPTASLVEASRAIQPALLVISAAAQEHLSPLRSQLEELARQHRLAIAGAGASSLDSTPAGVLVLKGDPVTEAQRVSLLARNG
jgi:MerR family transcriptional regulator, light-induced transcriptional regulator